MARMQGLDPEDQETLDAMMREAVNGYENARDIGRALGDLIREAEADGNERAARIGRTGLDGACAAYARQWMKEQQTGTVRIGGSGLLVPLPSRYGVQKRDPETGRADRSYTLGLWTEMSWVEFADVIRAQQNRRDTLSHRITAMREILRLREIYPESQTPGQACQLAGIDPASFEIDEQAA